jgi:type IV pilus assembly protein PilW
MTVNRQHGLTLIEIMVALTLGLILLAGVLQIMASNKQTFRVQEGLSEVQENGRTAIRLLSEDIRLADFWGCGSQSLNFTDNLDETDDDGYIEFNPGQGLWGNEGAAGAPDTITIQGADKSAFRIADHADESSPLEITAGNALIERDVLLVTDCDQGDLFVNTNADVNADGLIAHALGESDGAENKSVNSCDPGQHCLSRIYGADALVFKIRQATYGIGVMDDGEPALQKGGVNLVPGIEDLQVLFGEELSATTGTVRYVPSNTAGLKTENVKSVRLSITVRSKENNLADDGDGRLRRTFSTTIALRNRNP